MNTSKAETLVSDNIRESIRVKETLLETMVPLIAKTANLISESIASGGKLILFGNGGSAGDAQHIAAELLGRFELERPAFPAIALTTNSSTLTAIANDYGYEQIFSRQIQGLTNPGDVVIGISTSGNSLNVLKAIRVAKEKGATTIGMTGEKGGQLVLECTHCFKVPSSKTARIQESHIMIGHLLCLLIEQNLS
ncbi:Phosphoheptose isomerase 1 [hydrothermal vent metagenome]|uniref:D-sedoheptulose-7-phosphate isomerase n=1 Tax=hydrothermal vent metagenome TaxID=652676 RepID=A0A3B1CNB4_9ZZZZ